MRLDARECASQGWRWNLFRERLSVRDTTHSLAPRGTGISASRQHKHPANRRAHVLASPFDHHRDWCSMRRRRLYRSLPRSPNPTPQGRDERGSVSRLCADLVRLVLGDRQRPPLYLRVRGHTRVWSGTEQPDWPKSPRISLPLR